MAQNNGHDGLHRTELIGAGLALGWLAIAGLVIFLSPSPDAPFDGLRFITLLVVLFLPVAVIVVAMSCGRSLRLMRDETYRLQVCIDKLRRENKAAPATRPEEQVPAAGGHPSGPVPVRPQGFAEAAQPWAPQPTDAAPVYQPTLALEPVPPTAHLPLDHADLVRALHFPDDENDSDGFAALRRALKDRDARKLVQAAQDVLTLLSQDGIYMDDMHNAPVGAEMWRQFAKGERGDHVAALGAVQDETMLETVTSRLRRDPIFRDAAHHFLRRFDRMLVTFEQRGDDDELLAMADTRTARAFVLLGRAAGTFG